MRKIPYWKILSRINKNVKEDMILISAQILQLSVWMTMKKTDHLFLSSLFNKLLITNLINYLSKFSLRDIIKIIKKKKYTFVTKITRIKK